MGSLILGYFVLAAQFFSWLWQTTPAQEELQLRLKRNFGYSSGSGAIQGNFTMTATGPEEMASVEFFLDGDLLGQDAISPFQLRFVTDDYPVGDHTLQASGLTTNGTELRSNEIRVRFVTAEEGWQAGLRIVIPLLVVVGGAILLSVVVPVLFTRGRRLELPPGAPRNYGFSGGAICPKCLRPFALHLYGVNLVGKKLDRCPYCGRWSAVRRANRSELAAAEAAELEREPGTQFQPEVDSEEQLRREVDDSRFSDL
jgi:hypothetical protein